MTINGNTYGASLLRSIGIDIVTADHVLEYPTVTLDRVAALDPAVIVVPSEPYSFNDAHLAELTAAFPRSTVVPVDGEDLFWWGIRTEPARGRLASALADPTTAQQ